MISPASVNPGVSPTLAINESVRERISAGEDILHLGFGEAGVPVHPLLRHAFASASADGGYGEVAGSRALREAVAAFYTRRGLETDAWQIVVGPGSKSLLFALMLALDGDLVLPQPAWVSYAAQATLTGKQVIWVPIPAHAGGVPDPELLSRVVNGARDAGNDPRTLLITQPDNPTGTFASRDVLKAVVEQASSCGLQLVSDEIYADLVHLGGSFTSAAAIGDGNCILTGGLSKSLAIGGWRIGVIRVPPTPFGSKLVDRVRAIASEVWSCIPGPVAAAAEVAYSEPSEIVEHIELCRRLHGQVSAVLHGAVCDAGAACRPPTAAFYLYPDLGQRPELIDRGIDGGMTLAQALLDRHRIAVLPGEAFGDDPSALRFRVATSLLYGSTDEERWAALRAAADGTAGRLDPVVAAADRLRIALASPLGE